MGSPHTIVYNYFISKCINFSTSEKCVKKISQRPIEKLSPDSQKIPKFLNFPPYVSYKNDRCFLQTVRDQDFMETTVEDLQMRTPSSNTYALNETRYFPEYDLSLQIQAFGSVIIITLGLIGMF